MACSIPQTVLNWLLEVAEPSVRHRTLVELLDRPMDDAAVQEDKTGIVESAPVRRMFAKMHPEGYWLHRRIGDGVAYAHPATTHFACLSG